jgi:hypothetical protein
MPRHAAHAVRAKKLRLLSHAKDSNICSWFVVGSRWREFETANNALWAFFARREDGIRDARGRHNGRHVMHADDVRAGEDRGCDRCGVACFQQGRGTLRPLGKRPQSMGMLLNLRPFQSLTRTDGLHKGLSRGSYQQG